MPHLRLLRRDRTDGHPPNGGYRVALSNAGELQQRGRRAVGQVYRCTGYYLGPRRQGRGHLGEAQAANGWACRMPAGGMGAVQPLSAKAPESYSRENSK